MISLPFKSRYLVSIFLKIFAITGGEKLKTKKKNVYCIVSLGLTPLQYKNY